VAPEQHASGGSSDFQVRVFAAAVKGVDKKPEDTIWATGDKLRTFGAVLHEFASRVWQSNRLLFLLLR
jgi:hypothetical protein